jgi:hypothetical protein
MLLWEQVRTRRARSKPRPSGSTTRSPRFLSWTHYSLMFHRSQVLAHCVKLVSPSFGGSTTAENGPSMHLHRSDTDGCAVVCWCVEAAQTPRSVRDECDWMRRMRVRENSTYIIVVRSHWLLGRPRCACATRAPRNMPLDIHHEEAQRRRHRQYSLCTEIHNRCCR